MKYLILACALFVSVPGFTSVTTPILLHCKATYNYNVMIAREIAVVSNSKSNLIGEFESLVILLNHRDELAELEVYNPGEESRSYAKASIKNVGDKVELARWTRDYIIEVTCERLAQ